MRHGFFVGPGFLAWFSRPPLFTGTRIYGPGIVGQSEIQDAVYSQGSGFDIAAAKEIGFCAGVSIVGPYWLQIADVSSINLFQRAVTPAGVIAIISRPRTG